MVNYLIEGSVFYKQSWFNLARGPQGFWGWDNMVDPPCRLQNSAFFCFQRVCPKTSNTSTFDREKNTSFDSILQRLYLQKLWKKKSHFLADGSIWNRSQESCFWFMLNCTLNTEQYSCPFFILFTLYRLHILTHRKYTHPPTQVPKNLYTHVPNNPAHAHPASKETLILYKFRRQRLLFWMYWTLSSLLVHPTRS